MAKGGYRGDRKLDRVRRAARLRKLEKFLLLGLTHEEMAEKLGVSVITVRRDLQLRMDGLQEQIQGETAAYRSAILAELGEVISEAHRDGKRVGKRGMHTFPYLSVRIDATKVIARLTGAEAPSKNLHLIGVMGGGRSGPQTFGDGKLTIEIVPNGMEQRPDTSHLIKDCSNETDINEGT
jgi:hypothetical protein